MVNSYNIENQIHTSIFYYGKAMSSSTCQKCNNIVNPNISKIIEKFPDTLVVANLVTVKNDRTKTLFNIEENIIINRDNINKGGMSYELLAVVHSNGSHFITKFKYNNHYYYYNDMCNSGIIIECSDFKMIGYFPNIFIYIKKGVVNNAKIFGVELQN